MSDNTIATNRKAFRDFQILETFEAGIELKGAEVKSLRDKKAALTDAFARIEKGGVWLYNCYIADYSKRDGFDKSEPTRVRRLLLHKREITKLLSKTSQKGLALIALKLYFNKRGFAKVELGLAKGRKLFDRRENIKERDIKRGLRRIVRE